MKHKTGRCLVNNKRLVINAELMIHIEHALMLLYMDPASLAQQFETRKKIIYEVNKMPSPVNYYIRKVGI